MYAMYANLYSDLNTKLLKKIANRQPEKKSSFKKNYYLINVFVGT